MPICPAGHEGQSSDFCDVCGMRIGGTPAGSGAPPAEPCPVCGTARSGKFCEVCGFGFTAGTAGSRPRPVPVSVPAAGGWLPAGLSPAGPSPPAGASPLATTSLPTGGGFPASASGLGAVSAPGIASTPGIASAPGTGSFPAPAGRGSWVAEINADRGYYLQVVTAGGPDAAAIAFPDYCPERRFQLTGQEMRIGRHSVSRGIEPEIDLAGPPTDPGISHLHAVLLAEPGGGWSVLDPGSANGTQVNGQEIAVGVRVPVGEGDRICIGAWTVLTIRAG